MRQYRVAMTGTSEAEKMNRNGNITLCHSAVRCTKEVLLKSMPCIYGWGLIWPQVLSLCFSASSEEYTLYYQNSGYPWFTSGTFLVGLFCLEQCELTCGQKLLWHLVYVISPFAIWAIQLGKQGIDNRDIRISMSKAQEVLPKGILHQQGFFLWPVLVVLIGKDVIPDFTWGNKYKI